MLKTGGNKMMSYRSLRFRIVFWYSIVFVLAFVLIEIGIYLYLDRSLHREIDMALSREAVEFAEKLMVKSGVIFISDSVEFREPEHFYLSDASVFFRIFDKNLNLVAISENLKRANFVIPKPERVDVEGAKEIEINGKRLRIFYLPIRDENGLFGLIEMSKFEGAVQTAMGLLRTSLFLALLLAIIIVSYGGGVIVSKFISPLEQIIDKADKINAENLTERINVNQSNPPDEIVKLVNSLNRLLERLERSFKQIAQFTYDVSHELLTPLTVMKDEIEISLMRRRKVKDYIQTLNVVYRQVNRSIDIIRSMLYLAKVEAGVINVNLREVNLPELIREVILTLNHKAKRKNIKVKFNCDSILISKTDENILFEALKNILDNAIEYTGKNGSVEIKCERVGKWLEISISDNGIGISADDLPYIFNRFYRGRHALELNPTGTGLGLALTKSMIELLKGKINVSSELGKGTTFIVQIPA